jgi:hypothetical protein
MYQRAMSHRPACFEPNPDKAPLADLCDSCRDTLQGIAERRHFCSICELTITKGELYFVAEMDHDAAKRVNNTGNVGKWTLVEPIGDGSVRLTICGACARTFDDQQGFVGMIAT